jgi:hypothetical protein
LSEKIAQVRFGIEKAERDYDRDFDGVGSAKPLEEERTQGIRKGGGSAKLLRDEVVAEDSWE